MRRAGYVFILMVLIGALAAPVSATKPDDGSGLESGHQITICHATRSLSNPYVKVTIDIAAWEDDSGSRAHGAHHTRSKNGVTWADYELQDPQGECSLGDGGDAEL